MAKYRFEQIAINSTEKRMPSDDDRLTYIGLEHLDSGSLTVRRWGSAVPLKGEKLVMHKGDVLLGKRNAYLRRAAIAPHDGIFSAHGMVLRPREDVIDKTFFPLFIASDYFFDTAIRISVGSLSPTVNWKDLRISEFEIPDLETQKKLAQVLWATNDTMETYKKLISATDELVKSQFIEMFGDVNEYASIGSLSINGPQNGFYRKNDGKTPNTHIVKMKELFANKCIADENVFDMVNMTPVEQKKFSLTSADLLFGRRSLVVEGAGKCSRVGNIHQLLAFESSILRITLDTSKVIPRYVQGWFETEMGRRSIESIRAVTTIAGIKGSDLKKTIIPVPPLAQQEKFAAFVRQSDKSKFELEKALSELTATYKRIIAENLG